MNLESFIAWFIAAWPKSWLLPKNLTSKFCSQNGFSTAITRAATYAFWDEGFGRNFLRQEKSKHAIFEVKVSLELEMKEAWLRIQPFPKWMFVDGSRWISHSKVITHGQKMKVFQSGDSLLMCKNYGAHWSCVPRGLKCSIWAHMTNTSYRNLSCLLLQKSLRDVEAKYVNHIQNKHFSPAVQTGNLCRAFKLRGAFDFCQKHPQSHLHGFVTKQGFQQK